MKDENVKNALLKPEEVPDGNLPAVMSFEADEGDGFGNAIGDPDSFTVPFLVVLQSNSPQCDPDNAAHVKGAAVGMFLNTATKELYDGKAGVVLVPVYFRRALVRWKAREKGGGFLGALDPSEVNIRELPRDDKGRFLYGEEGDYLSDTRYHYCVQVTNVGPRFVVFALASTQIKKSRTWNTQMQTIKLNGTRGQFTPPTYSHAYRATTVSESNEKGQWKGVSIEMDHILGLAEYSLYAMAKAFKEQVAAGKAEADESARGETGTDGLPF